jgi:type I restriction enzyme, R subunit
MTERDLINEIEPLLQVAGWETRDFIREPNFVSKGRTIRPDFVLCQGDYPLSVIEVGQIGVDPRSKVDQVLLYAQEIRVETGYVITGRPNAQFEITKVDVKSRALTITDNLPNPKDLGEAVGLRNTTTDPRFYPFHFRDQPPRLNHVIAVRRALDSVVSGNRRVLVFTPLGSGITNIGFQIAWKLLQSGFCHRILIRTSKEWVTRCKFDFSPTTS